MFSNQNCKKLFLLDFGITKFEKTAETEILGISYFYSAPEISITEKSLISSKSDMFSFGMFMLIFQNIYFILESYMNLLLDVEPGKINL